MAIQPDGKIILVGRASIGSYKFAMVRYNTDGTLDQTFGTNGNVTTKETNNKIIGNLQENRKNLKKENQWIVDKMILDLKNVEDNNFWEEFNLCFRDVNQEFQEKINNQYPDLTHNESRLCAFLYLDMTTKEIANITGQSIDSINLARTRLRNKVGLTSQNISINTFLKSL